MRHQLLWLVMTCLVLLLGSVTIAFAQQGSDGHAKPAAADAEKRAAHVRIVDWGDDYQWEHGKLGGISLRGQGAPTVALDVDVDGDGRIDDDSVGYDEFSLTKPFNPRAPWYDLEGNSAVFYGGGAGFFANTRKPYMSERCMNVDHAHQDNLAYHAYHETNPGDALRLYVTCIWKKRISKNGGDSNPVAFDDTSRIAFYISRYWRDYEEGRFVVQDGETFYISEYTYAGNYREEKGIKHLGKTHLLTPTQSRWAVYTPTPPYHIDFDAKAATFAAHTFTDVQAVGFYLAKPTLAPGQCWIKWNAFEVEATVTRPVRPSETLDMVAIPAGKVEQGNAQAEMPGFYLSATEIPYDIWRKVYRWGVSNQYAVDPGYIMASDGDMGSMAHGAEKREAREPVTNITWLDAVAWCNMLSEYEGKTPCYYADAAKTQVFRKVRERVLTDKYTPKVFVKWEADGYRLPTLTEWWYASGIQEKDITAYTTAPEWAWLRKNTGGTHPVGSTPAINGLYDMLGNVWEWCWPAQDQLATQETTGHQAVGLSYLAPVGTPRVAGGNGVPAISSAGDIGFRVMRMAKGTKPPIPEPPTWQKDFINLFTAQSDVKPEMPPIQIPEAKLELMKLEEGTFIRKDDAPITVSSFEISKTEISYTAWRAVYQWAMAHGYYIDHDGDMGSMDRQTGKHTHTPDEPVTDISWYDALVWCNARSEMMGKTPCYYSDKEKTKVYKSSLPFRMPMGFADSWWGGTNPELGKARAQGRLREMDRIYCKWEADGYRLPTDAEWQYAYQGGKKTPLYWGTRLDEKFAWYAENSGGTTHPVGQLEPNAFGLHDMAGNVWEWCWDSGEEGYDYYDRRNPKGQAAQSDLHTVRGGSFVFGQLGGSQAFTKDVAVDTLGFASYPEIGFRVVRCEQDVHPAGGEPKPEIVLLDIDPTKDQLDPLQNAIYRGNLARTGVYQATGVAKFNKVKWQVKTGGAVKATPVTVNGFTYLGSTDGFFYALNAATGEEKWKFAVKGGVESSAAVANETVFFGGNDGYAYALDAVSGKELWRYSVEQHWLRTPVKSSPAVAYGVVFCSVGNTARGLDAKTGKEVWRFRGNNGPDGLCSPAIVDGILYYGVGGEVEQRYAVNLRSGIEAWRVGVGFFANTPPVADGLVFHVGSHNSSRQNRLTAIDIKTGQAKWTLPFGGAENNLFCSPAAANGLLYFGSNNGHLYALDVQTGKEQWKFTTGKAVQSAPSLADGRIYFGSADGKLYVLDAKTGTEQWHYDAGSPINTSPAIGDGVVYFACDDGTVYAVE